MDGGNLEQMVTKTRALVGSPKLLFIFIITYLFFPFFLFFSLG